MKKIVFGLCAVMMCSSVFAMQTQSLPKKPTKPTTNQSSKPQMQMVQNQKK